MRCPRDRYNPNKPWTTHVLGDSKLNKTPTGVSVIVALQPGTIGGHSKLSGNHTYAAGGGNRMDQDFSLRFLQKNSSHVLDTVVDARHTHYELLPLQDADIRYYPCFFTPETAERYFQTLLREVAFEQRTL